MQSGMQLSGRVDGAPAGALALGRKMASGPKRAYARSVVWGHGTVPTNVDSATVYVFDARNDDSGLSVVTNWLAALSGGRKPLTVVIAPGTNDAMTMAEHDAFESAIDSLWAYPLSRPSSDADLLAYVSSLLTVTPPQTSLIARIDVGAIADAPDTHRHLRRIDLIDRID